MTLKNCGVGTTNLDQFLSVSQPELRAILGFSSVNQSCTTTLRSSIQPGQKQICMRCHLSSLATESFFNVTQPMDVEKHQTFEAWASFPKSWWLMICGCMSTVYCSTGFYMIHHDSLGNIHTVVGGSTFTLNKKSETMEHHFFGLEVWDSIRMEGKWEFGTYQASRFKVYYDVIIAISGGVCQGGYLEQFMICGFNFQSSNKLQTHKSNSIYPCVNLHDVYPTPARAIFGYSNL